MKREKDSPIFLCRNRKFIYLTTRLLRDYKLFLPTLKLFAQTNFLLSKTNQSVFFLMFIAQ